MFRGDDDSVSAVAIRPDGRQVLTGFDDGTVAIWDADTGALVRELRPRTFAILSVAASSHDNEVVTGSEDNSAIRWDTGLCPRAVLFKGHTGPVSSIALSGDARHSYRFDRRHRNSLGRDNKGAYSCPPRASAREMYAVALSDDGKHAVTGSIDGTAELWATATGQKIRDFRANCPICCGQPRRTKSAHRLR